MGCNCKGKREGNDLKFFRSITQVTKEILDRPINKITSDMTIESKVQMYRNLLDALQQVDKITGGKLSE